MTTAQTEVASPKTPLTSRPVFWLGISGIFGFFLLSMWGMIMGWERPLQPGDEELLLTVEDLHVDGQVDIEPDSVRTWRTQFIDLSVQLDYEFESDDVYMSSTINREMSSRDARNVYLGLTAGIPLGAALTGEALDESERNELFSWGEQSRLTIVEMDGQPVGNYFIAREGKYVFSLLLSGVYYDDAEDLEALLEPALEAMLASEL